MQSVDKLIAKELAAQERVVPFLDLDDINLDGLEELFGLSLLKEARPSQEELEDEEDI